MMGCCRRFKPLQHQGHIVLEIAGNMVMIRAVLGALSAGFSSGGHTAKMSDDGSKEALFRSHGLFVYDGMIQEEGES